MTLLEAISPTSRALLNHPILRGGGASESSKFQDPSSNGERRYERGEKYEDGQASGAPDGLETHGRDARATMRRRAPGAQRAVAGDDPGMRLQALRVDLGAQTNG